MVAWMNQACCRNTPSLLSLFMVEIEIGHSRLIPYAVALAKANGARYIYIEPRLPGIITPDVLGIRESRLVNLWENVKWMVTEPSKDIEKPLVIVQVETSTGAKLGSREGDKTLQGHARAASVADFFYILDRIRDQPSIRSRIADTISGATVYSEDDMVRMFGIIRFNIEPATNRSNQSEPSYSQT